MEKIEAAWAKFQEKVGADVAIAIAAGVVVAIFVHPVVGILGAVGYVGYKKGWHTKLLNKFKD